MWSLLQLVYNLTCGEMALKNVKLVFPFLRPIWSLCFCFYFPVFLFLPPEKLNLSWVIMLFLFPMIPVMTFLNNRARNISQSLFISRRARKKERGEKTKKKHKQTTKTLEGKYLMLHILFSPRLREWRTKPPKYLLSTLNNVLKHCFDFILNLVIGQN